MKTAVLLTEVLLTAKGSTPAVTLPQHAQFNPKLVAPKYLRVELDSDASRSDVFEVAKNPRAGARGIELYIQPGQLQVAAGSTVKAWATPVSTWAWRRAQLGTTNGRLVLATLIAATTSAWIDGSLGIGKVIEPLWLFSPGVLGLMSTVSMFGKFVTAGCAFLLALWFKK